MNKSDLEELVRIRIEEASVLLKEKKYHGAYYLIGYALECAIKVCIAKQVKENDFPNKKLAQDSYIHDLEKLMGVAGLTKNRTDKEREDKKFEANWAVTRDWSEDSRYKCQISPAKANGLFNSIMDTESGILIWVKNYW